MEVLAITLVPVLCIGFMIFSTITWARLETRMDQMREERRLIRAELDSLRTRLKTLETK